MPYTSEGTPFAAGSDTSEAAALSVEPKALTLARVLAAIRACGAEGATCDEVEASLDMRHQSASARVNELGKHGAIADSGMRRLTRSGRKATVWVATKEAES